MTHGMAPSRFRSEDLRTRPTYSTPPEKEKRHCLGCGAVLTWNPGPLCCLCEDKKRREPRTDHRTKIDPENHPHILLLRDMGTTHKRLAELFGVTPQYMCELVSKIRKGGIR